MSLLFRESASSVAARILEGSLALHLTENFRHLHGRTAGQSEVRSWERSLPALVNALMDAGLGEVEVLIEYGLPLTSKRADAVLAGVHPTTGEPSYVVVELKQWSAAYPEEDEPLLCRIDAYPQPVLNPVEQVRGYCDYLLSFNGALERMPKALAGVAFLHNATESRIAGLWGIQEDEHGRMYTGEQRGEDDTGQRDRLADPQHVQSAADSGHGRHDHLFDGPGDARKAALAGKADTTADGTGSSPKHFSPSELSWSCPTGERLGCSPASTRRGTVRESTACGSRTEADESGCTPGRITAAL